MTILQPPPTYQIPVIEDPTSKTYTFDPNWLNWFLQLKFAFNGKYLNVGVHNSLGGLQGGQAGATPALGQFYHLGLVSYNALVTGTSSDATGQHAHRAVTTTQTTIAAPASPATVTNTTNYEQWVSIIGATLTSITYTTAGGATAALGSLSGLYHLSPGDSLAVVFTGSATIIVIQR